MKQIKTRQDFEEVIRKKIDQAGPAKFKIKKSKERER
jgi:hypothetical protein